MPPSTPPSLAAAVRARDPVPVAGAGLFVAFMAAGYYYNVTFVQLGLLDLGTRLVGLSRAAVSVWMAVLALVTLAVAVAVGVTMDRRGLGGDLRAKLRLLLGVVVVQLLLTVAAPAVRTEAAFGSWIVLAAVALGVGVPASFSLAVDLVPVPDRGAVAAAATAVAYVAANAVPVAWEVESFARVMVVALLPGAVALAALATGRPAALGRWVDRWAAQHETHGVGRFCRPAPVPTRSAAFAFPLVLMFGVFFVDSLGFLQLVETPVLVQHAWQAPERSTRWFIAGAHVAGALAAGVLYANFDRRWLFLWTFGLFSMSHLLYTTDVRLAAWFPALAAGGPSLVNPGLYAVAVSFYTTLNFALWPDLSTTETVGRHVALGVGLAGWLATFLSTAVALYLQSAEVTLLTHLNLVNALALLLFVGLALAVYLRGALAAREVAA